MIKKIIEFNYGRRYRKHRAMLLIFVVVCITYFLAIRFPLPSDEEMIAHFKAHRAEFEEVVHRYRSFETGPTGDHLKWVDEEGTKELLEQAQIERVVFSSYTPWLPNPYSLETAKKRELALGGNETYQFWYRYGGLMVQPAPFHAYRARNLRYGDVWKDYYLVDRSDNTVTY